MANRERKWETVRRRPLMVIEAGMFGADDRHQLAAVFPQIAAEKGLGRVDLIVILGNVTPSRPKLTP